MPTTPFDDCGLRAVEYRIQYGAIASNLTFLLSCMEILKVGLGLVKVVYVHDCFHARELASYSAY